MKYHVWFGAASLTIIIGCQAFIDFLFAVIAVKTLWDLKIKGIEKLGLTVAMSLGIL